MTDDRTAIVWQTLGAKPTRVRTQVADVARVILLYQKGLDPRSAGFCDLKADRRLLFVPTASASQIRKVARSHGELRRK